MAQYDGSIRINTSIDQRGFERGSKELIQGMKRLGNSLKGMISSLGFGLGIAGLVALGKQAIDTASDIQEVQNVVDTAFGSMSYKMEEFAKTSVKQFGISQLSAKQLGSTFMAMGKSMVGDMEKASNMAINLTARAADMSSFYNKRIEETSTALKSIYTGETESLKEYGVVMTQVNLEEFARQQGINKSIQAMTQAEKVELQYAYVMKQTSIAAGDFARTSDSWANQTRILSEQFKELSSVIGSGLIAALTPVVKFLNTILTQAIAIAKQIGALLGKLFGISVPIASAAKSTTGIAAGMSDVANNMDSAAGSAGGLKKGIESAGKAAKKAGDAARRSLAPFDKLTVLSKEASGAGSGGGGGGGSGGGGAGGGGFQMPQVELKEEAQEAGVFGDALDGVLDKLKELKDLFVAGFWDGLGDYKPILDGLKTDLDSIWQTLKDIFTDTEVLSAADKFFKSLSFAAGQVVGSIASVGLTIAANLIGGMEKYLTQNAGRIKKFIISMFDIGAEISKIIGNFAVAFADIFSVLAGDTAQQITGNLIGIFAEVQMLVYEYSARLYRDILNMITKPIIDNKDKIKTAIEETLQAIEPFTSGLLIAVQTVSDAILDIYDNHLKPLFDSIATGLSDILGALLDGYNKYVVPVLQSLSDKFSELMQGPFGETINKVKNAVGKLIDALKMLWENVLVPFYSWIATSQMQILSKIVDFIGNIVLSRIETMINVIGDIADVLSGLIDFVVGVFTGDWEKAWNGIKQAVSGVWKAIKDIISGKWNEIKVFLSTGAEIVKKLLSAAWNEIKKFTSNIWNGIKSAVSAIWNGMKSTASTAFNTIKTTVSGAWNVIKTTTSSIWNGIKTTVSGIWSGLKTSASRTFNKIKTTVVDVWNGIKTSTTNIWNGIKNAIKSPINAIIGFLNTLISGISTAINGLTGMLNNLNIDIPDWVPGVGGNSLGFNIPKVNAGKIPYLASGAVIRGGDPFMAVLGDQPRNQTNIETPLPTMVNAFKQAIAESGGAGGDISVRVYLGEKDITKAVKTEADTYFKRTGRPLFGY